MSTVFLKIWRNNAANDHCYIFAGLFWKRFMKSTEEMGNMLLSVFPLCISFCSNLNKTAYDRVVASKTLMQPFYLWPGHITDGIMNKPTLISLTQNYLIIFRFAVKTRQNTCLFYMQNTLIQSHELRLTLKVFFKLMCSTRSTKACW